VPARRFVVQRHRATRLHYDLRLELDGVAVSWAVPKGPTLDPAVRRLAVRVGDHGLDSLTTEAAWPGGGDTIVWDTGTWTPKPGTDPAVALAAGDLHVDLDGVRLGGRFALVQRAAASGRGDTWLLVKKGDGAAVPGFDPEADRTSVVSGLTNEALAAATAR
jgi:bifunctional non-homologous end joining protein LigD